MTGLEAQLTELRDKEELVLKAIDERNKRKKILCSACNNYHTIGKLRAIQTHWHTPPRGCTGGDYWNEGELQFVCPETEVIDRLLFNNDDVPWEERKDYDKDPEEQFKRNYKKLFKEVRDTYDKSTSGNWVNNFYVDQNRKKFGLVEKRKGD